MTKLQSAKEWLCHSRLTSRTGIGALVAGLGLVSALQPSPLTFGVAALLALSGSVIRFWSAGTIVKNRTLATTGPYAYVRNPLYSGSLLIAIAFFMLNGNPWFVIPAAVGALVVYQCTIRTEEALLTELFGDTYRVFRKTVPSIVPWKGRCDGNEGGKAEYSLGLSLSNREYNGVLGTLAMLVLFYIYLHWMGEATFHRMAWILVVPYIVIRAFRSARKYSARASNSTIVSAPAAELESPG